jgi:hypothetical protein
MYTLLSRIPRGLEPLRTTLEKHVQTVGLQAVQTIGTTALNDPKVSRNHIILFSGPHLKITVICGNSSSCFQEV